MLTGAKRLLVVQRWHDVVIARLARHQTTGQDLRLHLSNIVARLLSTDNEVSALGRDKEGLSRVVKAAADLRRVARAIRAATGTTAEQVDTGVAAAVQKKATDWRMSVQTVEDVLALADAAQPVAGGVHRGSLRVSGELEVPQDAEEDAWGDDLGEGGGYCEDWNGEDSSGADAEEDEEGGSDAEMDGASSRAAGGVGEAWTGETERERLGGAAPEPRRAATGSTASRAAGVAAAVPPHPPVGGASGRPARDLLVAGDGGGAANGLESLLSAVADSMRDRRRQFDEECLLKREAKRNERIAALSKLAAADPKNAPYQEQLTSEFRAGAPQLSLSPPFCLFTVFFFFCVSFVVACTGISCFTTYLSPVIQPIQKHEAQHILLDLRPSKGCWSLDRQEGVDRALNWCWFGGRVTQGIADVVQHRAGCHPVHYRVVVSASSTWKSQLPQT